jgi:hypothetical protein
LRNKKDILKQHKIKPLNSIEDDLANSTCINIKTFFVLAMLNGLNVMYIHKTKYFDFLSDDNTTENIHVVHQLDKPFGFSYEYIKSNERIIEYRNKYYKMVSIDKPINPIASYKLSELLELCEKLEIDLTKYSSPLIKPSITKKLTKQQIYDIITSTI